jgi:ribonuclease R
MPDYRTAILDYFTDPQSPPLRPKELAQRLRVNKSRLNEFRVALEMLLTDGRLIRAANGTLRPKRDRQALVGTIRRTSSGAGYFRPHLPPEEAEEQARESAIYVQPEDMRGALTGDEVELELLKRRRSGGQLCGRVLEVTNRARQQFVGLYDEQRRRGVVTIDGGLFAAPVSVGDPGAKGARPGDKVVVEMVRFPEGHHAGEAVITKVLGAHGEPGVDTLSIIHEFGLRDEFPEDVLRDARRQAQAFDETDLGGRLDLTGDTIITIDPIDARDFDDAISLSREERGHWRLGVHIADVAHFVKPGSPLDREAQRRGTSVYLPDRVLPMLPEILSNSLASLQSGKVRFTKSVFIDFTPEGIPTRAEFANSAINAVQRFAYEDVLPILAGKKSPRGNEPINDEVRRLLGRMYDLAMILRRRRLEHGALNLDLPEVKLEFDDDGNVAGAHKAIHDESHQIIEEFMLAANIAVARELHYRDWPFLRRVHAPPDDRKLRALSDFLGGLGFKVPVHPGRPHLQILLDQVRGEPEEYAVNFAVLRSMKQAEYSPAEVGHYALAEEEYCHFTSPIRRYPDLTIHRLFEEIVRNRKKAPALSTADLVSLGDQCSTAERLAQNAERELIKVKLLSFLKDRIGDEMEANITGVERFGFFCQGRDLPAEGLVHVRTLPADQWDYDDRGHALTGRRSGTRFRLGDAVRVAVRRVDIENRVLDFRLVVRDAAKKRPKPHVISPRPKKTRRKPR